jgi:DNA-binding response OmpR family regulator
MHVLLVEPHLPLAKPLLRGLCEEGITSDLARDAQEADALVRAGDYDALLVNWRASQANGASLVGALRKAGLLAPVLMFVPSQDNGHRLAAIQAGADDCLPLPFDFSDLLARLEAFRFSPGSHSGLTPGSHHVS